LSGDPLLVATLHEVREEIKKLRRGIDEATSELQGWRCQLDQALKHEAELSQAYVAAMDRGEI
jgi:hypothetical protein